MISRNLEAVLLPGFREDLQYWIANDRRVALRILQMIEATVRDPFGGIGKPEPLKGEFHGSWSRRITSEHRLVYDIVGSRIHFLRARFQYTR